LNYEPITRTVEVRGADILLNGKPIYLKGSIPILAVYSFLQKYFIKGITLGSVKG
jgi:hypothetical protein